MIMIHYVIPEQGYPGTGVLKNKAGITDQDTLDQFEQLMFLTRSEEALPTGNLGYAHYCKIHFHFFQDVYDWAGELRQIRTGKGESWFCFPEHIDGAMEQVFADLAGENHLSGIGDINGFAQRAAHYISEINAIHPFREGNGRCQLTLLTILVEYAHFTLVENKLNESAFMRAMVKSFHGDNKPLVDCIAGMIE